jgi:hypothetical protein
VTRGVWVCPTWPWCVLWPLPPPPGWSFKPPAYPYLVAHSGIGVPASRRVPHGWEEDLVCNKDSACEEEIAVTPSSWWELIKLRHVPHGWEEDLVCNKDSACEEEIAVTPSSWWELIKLLVVCNQVFFPTLFFIFKMNCFEKFTFF